MAGQGAAFWPLQLARELDDAILDIRLNELEVATIVFKSDGDAQRVLAYDAFLDAMPRTGLRAKSASNGSACSSALI
jgi:benzoyl-CoA-dihydrodiol lyase